MGSYSGESVEKVSDKVLSQNDRQGASPTNRNQQDSRAGIEPYKGQSLYRCGLRCGNHRESGYTGVQNIVSGTALYKVPYYNCTAEKVLSRKADRMGFVGP